MHFNIIRMFFGALTISATIVGFGCVASDPESVDIEIDDTLDTLSVCNATASCNTTGGSVSCSGSNVCSAADQNCASGMRGYVTCDGVTTYCSSCPCTVTASCDTTGGSVTCSGTSSCTKQNQNCLKGFRGKVTCDGATTYCTACPTSPQCSSQQCFATCGSAGGSYNSTTGTCACC